MRRFVIAPILMLAFATVALSPVMAHQSSGSDCGSLLGKIGTEGVKLLEKSWDVIKARIRKNNAEGWIEKGKVMLPISMLALRGNSKRGRLIKPGVTG